jgi:hypothetical protein
MDYRNRIQVWLDSAVNRLFPAGVLVVALTLVVACGVDGSEQTKADEPAATGPVKARPTAPPQVPSTSPEDVSADPDQCDILGPEAVARLAGQDLAPHKSQVGSMDVCIWGNLNTTGVQIARVSADEWALSLPQLVEPLRGSDLLPPEKLAMLEDFAANIESQSTIEPAAACEAFSLMLEASGQPHANVTLRVIPTRKDPQAISGQACVEGVYSTVMLADADLTASDDELQAVEEALRAVVDGS